MKKNLLLLLGILCCTLSYSQIVIKNKKYPSVFWEITGNGLTKPSYLFGTMHISSKIAFNLSDSFFMAIKNVDAVANEINPDTWQEDLDAFDMNYARMYNLYVANSSSYKMPGDYLSERVLNFFPYEKMLSPALYMQPATLNDLLYRTNQGGATEDFEEDTYLDLYIFQCAKKFGKRALGLESFEGSLKMMKDANEAAAKDKNSSKGNYEMAEETSVTKVEEAYRSGNLDLLDSINKLVSVSKAYDDIFLYKRNEIQANHIDSVLQKKTSLFAGVGAAHLPGTRGVIELLRKKGYKLRPVFIHERDVKRKEAVDKMRVPVKFSTAYTTDSLYKVDVPGKLYSYNYIPLIEQRQYADMSNGSYYLVTRVKTNSSLWGKNENDVYKQIDSLLYENVPGKIISRDKITNNGYNGFDIINRTRHGDLQRMQIFITPDEMIVFKMSGIGDYIKDGNESTRFFNSIQLKPLHTSGVYKTYSPVFGDFEIALPEDVSYTNSPNAQWNSFDKKNNIAYTVIRKDIYNFRYITPDSIDLKIWEECFAGLDFVTRKISGKAESLFGYPASEGIYKGKDSSYFRVKYVIRGPHYYALIAHAPAENDKMNSFFSSFKFLPYNYKTESKKKDSLLYYSVNNSWLPAPPKKNIADFYNTNRNYFDKDEDTTEQQKLNSGVFRPDMIECDTTGEEIFVAFSKSSKYREVKDTIKNEWSRITGYDSTWIIRDKKKYELPGSPFKISECKLSDTASSRMLWIKKYTGNDINFWLATETDTLSQPSNFIQTFFNNFNPADTIKSNDTAKKKSTVFFADYFSKDTSAHKFALKSIYQLKFDSSDFPQIKKAISLLSWNDKKYLDTKEEFISKLSTVSTPQCSNYLKELYDANTDTLQIQTAVLETLLMQQTSYSYGIFRDIVSNDPPVLGATNNSRNSNRYRSSSVLNKIRINDDYGMPGYNRNYDYDEDDEGNGNFLDNLKDTLELTKTILPSVLPLLNLDDYKNEIMELLVTMIDSNLLKAADYETWYTKFLLEAKQNFKKQLIKEKQESIQQTQKKQDAKANEENSDDDGNEENTDTKYDDDLRLYVKLLIPFYEQKPAVKALYNQLMTSSDKRFKYNCMYWLLKAKLPVNDTLINYFAGQDLYRYELFTDLQELKMQERFPSKYNDALSLAYSALYKENDGKKPDTISYITKLPARLYDKNGWIYFFKYKKKKNDYFFKIATVGLLASDTTFVEVKDDDKKFYANRYNINRLSDDKIKEDEPLNEQLQKHLKKLFFASFPSGKNFYYNDRYSVARMWGFE